jgi:hypothetical protein
VTVNEYKIELTGVFGHPFGHKQAWVCGFEPVDFLLERVTKAFLDGAVEHFTVVLRQVVCKIEAQGGFTRFLYSTPYFLCYSLKILIFEYCKG